MNRSTLARASAWALCAMLAINARSEAQCIAYPDHARWANSVPLSSFLEEMVVAGNLLYAAGHDFQVFDISNPESPALLGTLDTLGETTHMAVDGSIVYLADGYAGLVVVDVSNPAAPAAIATVDLGSYVTDVVLHNDYLYALTREAGLKVIDVGDPSAPLEVGTWPSTQVGLCLSEVEGYLYVIAQDDVWAEAHVLDISARTAPVRVGGVGNLFQADYFFEADATRNGGSLYLSHPIGAPTVLDISTPQSPIRVGTLPTGPARDVMVAGQHLFVCEYENGVTVLDLSQPASAIEAATLVAAENTYSTALIGSTLLVANGNSFLDDGWISAVALGDFAGPARVGGLALGGICLGVSVADDRAYVSHGASGVTVIDAANPSALSLIAQVDTPGSARQTEISGNFGYVADGYSGLAVLDLNGAPSLLTSLPTTGEARSVQVRGSWAYLATGTQGLLTVDVSVPSAPVPVLQQPVGGLARDLSIENDLVGVVSYATPSNLGRLDLFNLSTPSSPVALGSLSFPDRALAIQLDGGRAYVLTGDAAIGLGKLRVIDLADPAVPVEVASRDLLGYPQAIEIDEGIAYVTSAEFQRGALQVFDLSDPNAPTSIGDAAFRADPLDVAVDKNCVFVANAELGLVILPAQCSSASVRAGRSNDGLELTLAPNPTKGRLSLRLIDGMSAAAGAMTTTRIDILDAQGRRVRALTEVPAGGLVWDGRGERNEALPSGVYFARARSSRGTISRSFRLLR